MESTTASKGEAPITDFHNELRMRLDKTVFGKPINKGQIILLANDTNSVIRKTDPETELTLPDTSKFVVSNDGKLLTDISTVPTGHVVYEGKPAGYRFDYTYDLTDGEKVIEIGSYVTADGQVVKDVRHTRFSNGKVATLFYDKKTGELKTPRDIDITDSKGNGVPFSITPN
ncbi:MAG: hypothetical protein NTV24_04975 [Candidatus Woesebacteria bacterium]|nr:hypothetical protein [Candidatus Woesebacteria bacterium]